MSKHRASWSTPRNLLAAALAGALSLSLACSSSKSDENPPNPPVEEEGPANVVLRTGLASSRSLTTDLGYQVELTDVRLALTSMWLTKSETLGSFLQPVPFGTRVYNWLIPSAHAHASHPKVSEDGVITGGYLILFSESPVSAASGKTAYAGACANCHGAQGESARGPSLYNYQNVRPAVMNGSGKMPPQSLSGDALENVQVFIHAQLAQLTLPSGNYTTGTIKLGVADLNKGVQKPTESIQGSAYLAGTATRNGTATPFRMVLTGEKDREISGIPLNHKLRKGDNTLVQFDLNPAAGEKTLLDGVDFESLAGGQSGQRVEVNAASTDAAAKEAHDKVLQALAQGSAFQLKALAESP